MEKIKPAVIIDLDRTLCVRGRRGIYEFERCIEDGLNVPVAAVVCLFHRNGNPILFVTGRYEKYRPVTQRWLAAHLDLLPVDYRLFMRRDDDQRHDVAMKREIYETAIRGVWQVLFALEDRDRMVKAWREMGVACFQVVGDE